VRADYLVTKTAEPDVVAWSEAMEKQYKLFSVFYLWTPAVDAFKVAQVPANV
jgi:hypothetical protein